MAADMNRVTLVGRLTRPPELRQTAGGTSVCSIRLAVTSRSKRGDTWEDQSNYFDVVVFGKQAETAEQYLSKGRRIGVDGRLSWREWEAKDGTRRQSVEVVAQDVFFLDSKQDGAQGGPRNDIGETPRGSGSPAADDGGDIPFAASWV